MVGAEREERRYLGEAVAGREDVGVRRGPERGGLQVGGGDGGIVTREPRPPARRHDEPKIACASSPIARWLSVSSVSDLLTATSHARRGPTPLRMSWPA